MEGFGELMAVEQERLDQLTGALEAARRVEVELEAQHNAHAFVAAMDRATLARVRIDGGAWQATTLEAQGALLLAIQDLEECAAQCASKQAQLHAVHCEVALLRERIQWARMQTAHMRRSHDKQQQQSVEYREWETAERELRDTQTSLEQARHERAELEQWLRADEAAAHVQRMQERDVADATEQKRANLRALQAQLTVTLAADHAGQVAQLKEEEARLMPQVTRLNAERTQRACQLLEASVAHARAQVRK